MTTVPAILATSATGDLTRGTIERRAVGPRDVRIAIRWAGVCHSDIHTARGDWGPVPYPLAVGHEIVGEVVEIGADVTRHAVGATVGVGCMVGSCGECPNCHAGRENYCRDGFIDTYAAKDHDGSTTQGGYSREIVVREDFVLRIPASLPAEKAAPLLCAGITTYSPLRHWGVHAGTRVAVVGLGGLGHMGVKIARAMGAHVTVLSQSMRKHDDAMRLGAHAYAATNDPEIFHRLADSFDLILNTVSATLDVDAYLGLLDFGGTMVNVGAPPEPAAVTLFTLFRNQRSFSGSTIGGIAETQEMLEFCAAHELTPEVEFVTADQVNEAWARVVSSDVRYRFVIDLSTL